MLKLYTYLGIISIVKLFMCTILFEGANTITWRSIHFLLGGVCIFTWRGIHLYLEGMHFYLEGFGV